MRGCRYREAPASSPSDSASAPANPVAPGAPAAPSSFELGIALVEIGDSDGRTDNGPSREPALLATGAPTMALPYVACESGAALASGETRLYRARGRGLYSPTAAPVRRMKEA